MTTTTDTRKARRRAGMAASYAAQLVRGERVAAMSSHHTGMRHLLEQLGRVPTPGDELSLINPRSDSAYLGYRNRAGQRLPYVLSTDPADYVFESHAANAGRGFPLDDAELMAELRRRAGGVA